MRGIAQSSKRQLMIYLMVVLLFSTAVRAQFLSMKEVDVRQTFEADRADHYWIYFYARGDTSTGHAWVTWAKSSDSGHTEENWGFYPKDRTTSGELTSPFGLEGQLVDDAKSVPLATHRLMVRVDAAQYKASRTVLDKYRTSPPKILVTPGFRLGAKDCIDFVFNAGRSFGLAMPERSMTDTPEAYIGKLMNEIDRSYDMNLPNGDNYYGPLMIRPENSPRYRWPSGKGVYSTKDGTVMAGRFVDGKIEGQGEMRDRNGATFEGSFEKGFADRGLWRNGAESFAGVRHHDSDIAEGTWFYADGDLYSGTMNGNGERNGHGTYSFKTNGQSWEGEWSHDLISGHVLVKFKDGGRATVQQTSPMTTLNGPVTYTNPHGRVGTGTWGINGMSVTFPNSERVHDPRGPHDWTDSKGNLGLTMGDGPTEHWNNSGAK